MDSYSFYNRYWGSYDAMIYRFSPVNNISCNPPFVQELSDFNIEELNSIIEYGDKLPKTEVKLYGSYSADRVNAEGSYFPLNSDTKWIYDKYASSISKCNARTYNYDLTGLEETLYYHTYYGDENHHFGWHYDMGSQTPCPRKLSFSLQLSDESEYTGGNLEFMDLQEPLIASKGKGILVGFPSYKAHRVTPVTSGIRRALIAFAVGPNFK